MNVKGRSENGSDIRAIEHVVPTEDDLKIAPQKSYTCDLCDYTVRTKANLRAHRIKTHRIVEGEEDIAFLYRTKQNVRKVYHCPVNGCKYQDWERGFPKYSALRQHYIWVHGARDHMCSSCYRLFPSATLLERHQQSCGELHTCPKCGRRYSEMKYLKQHMKRMKHQVEDLNFNKQPIQVQETQYKKQVPHFKASEPNIQHAGHLVAKQDMECNDQQPQSSAMNQVQTLQPIILPVIVPVPINDKDSTLAVDTSNISAAITSALQPVIDRISNVAHVPHKLHDEAQMTDVGILFEGAEKKLVDAGSDTYVNLPSHATVGLETDIHAFLHPVGSQTDEQTVEHLFNSDFDKPSLHVETQTNNPSIDAFTDIARNYHNLESFDRLHVETQTNVTVDKMLMTQISPHLPSQTSSMVQVALTPPVLEEKKLTATVASEAYINLPNMPLNPMLQPVGSQTEDLFHGAFDRTCLHVETQTKNPHINDYTRSLQTPQPILSSSVAASEVLANMETQTDPIDAWIEAELADIQTQTYDFDRFLVGACNQAQDNM